MPCSSLQQDEEERKKQEEEEKKRKEEEDKKKAEEKTDEAEVKIFNSIEFLVDALEKLASRGSISIFQLK